MAYLELVTECEHGRLKEHWLTKDGKHPEWFVSSIGRPEGMCPGGSRFVSSIGRPEGMCPGGSRRRMELDYEAAYRSEGVTEQGRRTLSDVVSERWIKAAVNAALGLGESDQ